MLLNYWALKVHEVYAQDNFTFENLSKKEWYN